MTDSTKTATLTIDGQSFELPMYSGTTGPDVIDIRKLYAQAGVFTYDPGYTSTASCESTITFIDGEKGELLHRGYPIDQLAEKSHYLEVCYLLLYGELPTAAEVEDFENRVTRHTMVHEQMHNFFRGFRRDAHPMATLVGVVGAMSAFYADSADVNDEWQREVASIRMIAKLPTIAAMAYKYSIGQPFVYPRNELDYASNFLHMCFAVPAEDYNVDPILSRAMDRILHSMPIMSKTPQPQQCVWPLLLRQTPSPVLQRALHAYGALPTAAQTKPASKCSRKSERKTVFQSISRVLKTRTTPSALWASVIASIKTPIHAPRF